MPTILLRRSDRNAARTVLADRLEDLGAASNTEAASILGINDGTISRVVNGKALPGNRFIAAVLTHVPAPFDEIFETVDDEGLLTDTASERDAAFLTLAAGTTTPPSPSMSTVA